MKQNYWLKRIKKKKGSVYYYRLNKESGVVDEDQTAFHTTHQSNKAQAKQYVEKLIAEKRQSSSQLTFRKYTDPFFIWERCPRIERRLDEGKSIGKAHVRNSRRWLEIYVFPDPFSDLRMDRIRRADILDLRKRLKEKEKIGLNTVNKVINTVKTVFSEAYFRDEIFSDPGSKVGNISYKREEKGILTREELPFLFSEIPGIWNDLKTFCVFNTASKTGMRRSEVLALPWNALEFSEYTLDIYQSWKYQNTLGPPKSGKKRIIPVVYSLIEPLKQLQEESIRVLPEDLVFCHDDTGLRLSNTFWKKAFQRTLNKAGLDWKTRNLTPHSLRHSLNSHLLAAGADPIKVRGYFGWSDNLRQPILTPVQAGYTHWQPESLKDLLPIIEEIFEV